MKKVILLIGLITSLIITGCTKNEEPKQEEAKTIVYCSSCGEEANETTKFCSSCGEESKWLSEKPNIEEKKESKEDVDKEVAESDKKEDSNDVAQHSYKEEYIHKLNLLEEEIENGATEEMNINSIEATRFDRWDDMLNEIYALLKTQLTSSEMKDLDRKQLNWIEYKEAVENRAANGLGGSSSQVDLNGEMANITKERCYELVNTYMK